MSLWGACQIWTATTLLCIPMLCCERHKALRTVASGVHDNKNHHQCLTSAQQVNEWDVLDLRRWWDGAQLASYCMSGQSKHESIIPFHLYQRVIHVLEVLVNDANSSSYSAFLNLSIWIWSLEMAALFKTKLLLRHTEHWEAPSIQATAYLVTKSGKQI